MSRVGRPPLPPSQKRSHVILVKLTAEERTLLDRARGNERAATFARKALMRVLDEVRDHDAQRIRASLH